MGTNDGQILKPWKCKNGHTLGVVQRIEVSREFEGKPLRYRTTRLMLYRHAVDLSAEAPAEVEVMANVEGTTMDVCCDVDGCGAVRSWFVGELPEVLAEAVRRAMAQGFGGMNAEER